MVVAGAFVIDSDGSLLLQQRIDNAQWGLPGGFMELGENISDAARREVYEETGLLLEHLELFGIYSGPEYDKTFPNGDQVSLVQVLFTCKQYNGDLIKSNDESLRNEFSPMHRLAENIFTEHKVFIDDLLSKESLPIVK